MAGPRRLRRGLKLDPVSEGQCVNTRRAPRARGRGRARAARAAPKPCASARLLAPGTIGGAAASLSAFPVGSANWSRRRQCGGLLLNFLDRNRSVVAACGSHPPSHSCYLGWQLVGGEDGPSTDPGLSLLVHPSSSAVFFRGGGVGREVESYQNCRVWGQNQAHPLMNTTHCEYYPGILSAESHLPRCLAPGGSDSPREASGTTLLATSLRSRKML